MSLRPATRSDEDFFYYWRCRDEAEGARGGWYAGRRTTREQHRDWFTDRLHKARLLVWEKGDRLGIARIDTNGELSFSAEPGHMARMLREVLWFADMYGGRLKVAVDLADRARIEALEAAGFMEFEARFYCYRPDQEAA